MFGRGKNRPPPLPPQQPERQQSPDEIISEMLSAYQSHYYVQAKGSSNPNVEKAKAKLERARKIISDSRIGYSVCALLDHVRHWPSWSQRDDFEKWKGFPAENVDGGYDKDDRDHKRTNVNFTYSGIPYSLIFVEEGISTWNTEDMYSYGTVELSCAAELVVGLNIKTDISKDYDRWRFCDVTAFAPGDWMRQIVEIAALIDAHQARSSNQFFEEDVLKRASKIKL